MSAAEVPTGGRSWELLTPSEPVSAMAFDVLEVGHDGRRLVYKTLGPLPDALGGDVLSQNLGVRTDAGWQSKSISGAYELPGFDFGVLLSSSVPAISSDFSSVVKTFIVPMLPEAPPSPRKAVYRWTEDGGFSFVADAGEGGEFAGASDDLARIVFDSEAHLLPSDAGRTEGRSVYVAVGSTIEQVDVDSNGELLSACGSSVPLNANSVSGSGERIYFVNPVSSGACGTPSRVFLRRSDGTTTEVSASQCSGVDCGSAQAVSLASATPSGSVAFLTTTQRLTNADENSRRDLYRYTADTGELDLVSPGSAGMEGEVTTDPVRASADGSVAYFYAQGPLLPGEGTSGSNLYVTDQAGLRFVASVAPNDPLEISHDGRLAALSTAAVLDPADADTSTDTYVFDEEGGGFTIASQGPSGGNGAFGATMLSSIEPLLDTPTRHPFSSDGGKVFFETAEKLVPEDQNEVVDVYEWDAGSLGLISSGTGSSPAGFAGASPDGETVVFRTTESLLPRDLDGGDFDLYVARPGGGFDEEEPPAPSCGSPCRPLAAVRVERPNPASSVVRPERKGKIKLRPIGGDACRDLLREGRLAVSATVPRPGRVSATMTDRAEGKRRTLLRGVAGAVKPGEITMRLIATAAAKAVLRAQDRLRVRLVLRQGDEALARSVTLRCGAGR